MGSIIVSGSGVDFGVVTLFRRCLSREVPALRLPKGIGREKRSMISATLDQDTTKPSLKSPSQEPKSERLREPLSIREHCQVQEPMKRIIERNLRWEGKSELKKEGTWGRRRLLVQAHTRHPAREREG